MRIVRHYRGTAPEDRGASAAIGNFDGVHLGHQHIIDIARRGAQERSAPLGVLTFEPHPRQYFAPVAPPFRLMSAQSRANRLARLGVERLYELPFDAALAALPPEAFAREVIHEGLGLSHIVIGADFRFGAERAGDAADLRRFGERMGFDVSLADLVGAAGGEISSTRIREALSAGDPVSARRMLGHHHRIEGAVIGGERRGRELGYPTANMSLEGLHLPAFGVYAVRVQVLDGAHAGSHDGVASLGVRPMFGENTANLETHLFDFSGDLYGAQLSVALVAYLRPEERFESLDALIAQMDADSREARRALQSQP
ncbi:bifunctional riboflavin kinase/FAD synthetase [Profundibacterium mesophilum]|uniref:Riboflavin biosynthesis protein n=1 Tax=Profundibacterium mesophilum KAUST100406-0324 TaxID=1037889 RepID=A0A921TBJ6_9RHOB|nr:bifunctional riboflavin kinase/FAD synthetase [Profundibacterium mesophilum]KAF0675780.1 FMN adenylyltransferase riboflavin kinase [Profundibacterium mesophilum KAUST100406-0324]